MRKSPNHALHAASIFEAAKGLLVLVTGFGILHFIHHDLHAVAAQLLEHLHFHPAAPITPWSSLMPLPN